MDVLKQHIIVSGLSGGSVMKAYVISMTSATERRRFQKSQLTRLSIEHEICDAVTVKTISSNEIAKLKGDWERPMSNVEVACYLSHYRLWQRVLDENQPALILEDDAILSDDIRSFLSELGETPFNHISLETRRRKKLLGKEPVAQVGSVQLHRLYQDRTGAAAYLLSPMGARKLLARHKEYGAALADAQICRAYELESYQTVPALAVQADCAEHYGVEAPIATTSSILNSRLEVDYDESEVWRYKLRRIASQLRMGRRQLTLLGRAKRVHVDFKSEV
ncbi:MAG: glycosyltransferase family 25 protein [Gammaproteobacteria bacterium]|nr:glycosyltransferase family 25 protein [Gammaproteobacteria bacterium]